MLHIKLRTVDKNLEFAALFVKTWYSASAVKFLGIKGILSLKETSCIQDQADKCLILNAGQMLYLYNSFVSNIKDNVYEMHPFELCDHILNSLAQWLSTLWLTRWSFPLFLERTTGALASGPLHLLLLLIVQFIASISFLKKMFFFPLEQGRRFFPRYPFPSATVFILFQTSPSDSILFISWFHAAFFLY